MISVDRSISSDSDRISVDNNGPISLDVEIKTKSHNLIAHCMYIELIDSWSINSINDSETQNCYYSYDDGRFTNIYDYKTDKLLTESREDISNHDPIAEFNEQSESIDAEFDAGLKSLADKYGLEYLE